MEITFLGTGSGAPSRTRNVSGIALVLTERGELWLFDCGEGTQHQILRAPQVRLSQLTRLFITHLHGDHLFGVLGLLATRALAQGGTSPVTLYGPEGLGDYVRVSLRASGMRFGFPVEMKTVRPGIVFEDDEYLVRAAPVRHRIEAYAYAVVEKPRSGRFDVAAARARGVPDGPLFGRLKAGQTVTLPDGSVVSPDGLIGPARPGRKIVLSGDTMYCRELVEMAHRADILIHEATYAEADRALADRAAHSTAEGAASVAREAEVSALYLTHFSPRYESVEGLRLEDLLQEAQRVFPASHLAFDLLRVPIPRREITE
ncbi:MAG: ribonuclease Z [Capsulimonadales bacterium]|nr:ribonuclease Z [Capsulimonadales bacterium]